MAEFYTLWIFMEDITVILMGVYNGYKATNITGGPHPVEGHFLQKDVRPEERPKVALIIYLFSNCFDLCDTTKQRIFDVYVYIYIYIYMLYKYINIYIYIVFSQC